MFKYVFYMHIAAPGHHLESNQSGHSTYWERSAK